ncbi:hypothetical protein BJ170DRAFT_656324 [Xylariales sp. AK1849]|nr:hypothetical protein BJ170DRAFT_656324 [Xylariales sp. AK1849]
MTGLTADMPKPPSYGAMLGLAAAFVFAVANAKALPLVYSFRLLPSLYRLIKPRLSKQIKSKILTESSSGSLHAAFPALFKHHVTTSRAIAFDLDVNMHKSNGTFFTDADISRAVLLTSLLSGALAQLGPANFILAGVQCRFSREISPYQAYAISSRMLAWDETSLYLVTYFMKPGMTIPVSEVSGGPASLLKDEKLRRNLFATMITMYVFKAGRTTISPEDVFRSAGLLVSVDQKSTVERDDRLMDIEDVVEAVRHGLEYIRECMV